MDFAPGGRRSPTPCGGARRGFPTGSGSPAARRAGLIATSTLSERLAAGLAARGTRRGDKVAVLARNSHGFVALRYALMRLGAVMAPINFMLQPDDIGFILNHSGARMLASDSGMAEVARKAASLAPHVTEFLWLPSEEESAPVEGMTNFHALLETGGEPPGAGPESFDVAQIVYTSGTESRPKGVQLTHDAILWQYVSCMVDASISGDDVALHALPLYHCAQLDVFLGPSIYAGGVNIVTAKPVPDNVFNLIERERATSFFAPPTVWISMLRSPSFDGADLTSLRKGYYGASIMPVEVMREMARRMPNVRLWNLYGQTEIAPLATMLGPEDQLRKPGSCGKPVLNVETRVVDDAMRDVAPGEVGEIVHRSPHLMTGYYKDEEKTAEAFRGGWFHSGDLATVDGDGYVTVVDRKKDMIKTGGENVASREVEEAIYRLAGVSEVAVIGVPHAALDRGGGRGRRAEERGVFERDACAGARPQGSGRVQGPQAHRVRRGAAEEPERQDFEAPAARGAWHGVRVT